MREILFRGKRADNGEWFYGYLSKTRGLDYKLHPCIDYEDRGVMLSSIVDPETICQYTGLTDKNGKKIFEGDILSERPDCNKKGYIGYVEWDDKKALWRFRFPDNLEYFAALGTYSTSYRVIGNICDNPELLGGE